MPPPISVELAPHNRTWAAAAAAEGERLMAALGPVLLGVYHVGSTAIPGIIAKPILDLLPVVASAGGLDECRPVVEALGYEWWGELGLPGRRYCTRSDRATGRRLVQLHCYARGSPEIDRHLAFRDYLRHRPDIAEAYAREKDRCRRLHPDDSHAYGDCKGRWIARVEAEAVLWQRSVQPAHEGAEPVAAPDPTV
ncbi:MAG: GrpB family protein [Planctomycetes bacterium]|nr:GrpB family protein [Planctomycetota bacterium]